MSLAQLATLRPIYRTLLSNAAQRRRLVLVFGLMAMASTTEGIGLVLAVPMVSVVSGSAGGVSMRQYLPAAFSGSLSLGELLGAFFVLVTLRSLLVMARTVVSLQLQVEVVDALRTRAWRALLAADWKMLARQRRSAHASLLISDIDRAGYAVQQALVVMAIAFTQGALGLAALVLSPRIASGAGLAGTLVLLGFGQLRRRARNLGGGNWGKPTLRFMVRWARGWAHCARSRALAAKRVQQIWPSRALPKCAARSSPSRALKDWARLCCKWAVRWPCPG